MHRFLKFELAIATVILPQRLAIATESILDFDLLKNYYDDKDLNYQASHLLDSLSKYSLFQIIQIRSFV